jgi:predicted SnoaL-like aldol condensation-catalyzing enzyme
MAADDIVVIQAEYPGHGPTDAFTGFEIIRLVDGEPAERWLAMQPVTGSPAITDAPDHAEHPERTGLSRRVVESYTDDVLIGGSLPRIGRYVVTDLVQHTAALGSGIAPLCAALANRLMCYRRRLLTVADGEFVLTVCTGGVHDEPAVFYDLYRVDTAVIVEHWSVTTPVPESLPWSAAQDRCRAVSA